MSTRRVRGLEGWPIVGWAAVGVLAAAGIVFASHGTGSEGWRQLIRATARVSGSLFLAAFLAAPLRRLWPNEATAWLLRNRRAIGVSVGVAHLAHGAAIAVFVRMTGHESPLGTLVAAGLAYLFLGLMVATSFDASAAALGRRRWRFLHRTGLYYLWFVFGFTFGGTAATGDAISAGFALAFVLALPLRLYGLRGRAAPASAARSAQSRRSSA
ncbi:MAG: hypothetical protein HKP30_06190 [Myxococcales bacterium]|nr:hypothetical protein [Myxococcales bacterium]